MIVVRNVFRLKFGKAREAKEAMRAMTAVSDRIGLAKSSRVLTDVTGPFYTIVHEMTFPSLADFERGMGELGNPGIQEAYAKFVPLVESGHREIFTVVE